MPKMSPNVLEGVQITAYFGGVLEVAISPDAMKREKSQKMRITLKTDVFSSIYNLPQAPKMRIAWMAR